MTIKQIREKHNCVGYYGFGTGVSASDSLKELSKYGDDVLANIQANCTQCDLSKKCWQMHKEKVRKFIPSVLEYFQNNNLPDPYTTIMARNIEDGSHVACFGKPKDRGTNTLIYPFEKTEDHDNN